MIKYRKQRFVIITHPEPYYCHSCAFVIEKVSAGLMFYYRIVELCKLYSIERHAFGQPICKYHLHMRTLANMEVSSIDLVFKPTYLSAVVRCGKCRQVSV